MKISNSDSITEYISDEIPFKEKLLQLLRMIVVITGLAILPEYVRYCAGERGQEVRIERKRREDEETTADTAYRNWIRADRKARLTLTPSH